MISLDTLTKLAGLAGSVGSVLGKHQQGKAEGKIAQNTVNQNHDRDLMSLYGINQSGIAAGDRNALDRYGIQQNAQNQLGNLDLMRQQFGTANRSNTAKQAMIGALLGGGLKPTSIDGGGSGLVNSLNASGGAKGAMSLLGSQGASAQRTPLSFAGGQQVEAPGLHPLGLGAPSLSTPSQVDNGGFLSSLATIAQLFGAASPYMAKSGSGGRGQFSSDGSYLGE